MYEYIYTHHPGECRLIVGRLLKITSRLQGGAPVSVRSKLVFL